MKKAATHHKRKNAKGIAPDWRAKTDAELIDVLGLLEFNDANAAHLQGASAELLRRLGGKGR